MIQSGRGYSFIPDKKPDSLNTRLPRAGGNRLVKEMRGSIKWQTAQLAKAIFEAGISKQERTNPRSERYAR
jgi:hypothetical protein